MDFPILSIMVLVPLAGALLTLLMGGNRASKAKFVAAVFSAVSLVLAVYLLTIESCKLGDLTETYTWFKAAGIRALKTIAQTAAATIGTSAVLSEVNWLAVLSASVLAGILSLLTSLAGIPEERRIEDAISE